MIIRSLKLRNFRNYENAYLEFSDGMNLIAGENAQGKTNLLESLVYLSLTRSHRISNDRRLIRENEMFAGIQCVIEDGSEKRIESIIHPQGKTLLIDKVPVKKSSEFIGQLNVVLFAPDDLYIFNDQPRERRRVMNQEITKISRQYLSSLNQYQVLLRQRNAYLKQDKKDMTYMDVMDENMAAAEEVIVLFRKEFADMINEFMPEIYRQLSMDDIDVRIRYKCCMDSYDSLKQGLVEMHQESREKDIDHRMTESGIHREDLIFEIGGKDLTMTASQGQKRMAMLAFKLALLKYVEKKTGKRPVLLLDDVLSELDSSRQRRLLEMVQGPFQCLITATEVPDYMKNRNHREFRIENGTVAQISGGGK